MSPPPATPAPPAAAPHAELAVRFVSDTDVSQAAEGDPLSAVVKDLRRGTIDRTTSEALFGLPFHLRTALDGLKDTQERAHGVAGVADALSPTVFDSIPFYSLCKGLFLPLAGLHADFCTRFLGLHPDDVNRALPTGGPPNAEAREQLLRTFLAQDVGLDLTTKLACVLGDPFIGKRSTFKRDSLVALLVSSFLVRRRAILDDLVQVGDIAIVFTKLRPAGKPAQPLTAAEVLLALRAFPRASRSDKHAILRSLLMRMGKLEAYFLVKLVLRRAGFGFDYQGALLAQELARAYSADAEQVAHAIALTDVFRVAQLLQREGAAGLKRVHLQPLVPIRPALASGGIDDVKRYPVWVERKLDGIRLMLHKTIDASGAMLAGAYTRTRNDWLEDITGLQASMRAIRCMNAIIDGELHGMVLTDQGRQPATVYDVHTLITGVPSRPVSLRYAAFDLLYLNGRDLTGLPLRARREQLQMLLGPLENVQLPIPIHVVDGQLANNKDDVNRYFQHFRQQGYEGVIAKDLEAPYLIATRDPSWVKRKPVITLDLVLLAGVYAVTTKERTGMFGSFVIGARRADGSFEDVGDVAGVDVERDRAIVAQIMREGLITGRRIDRPSASGVRTGLELRPHLVVTIKFDGITRDNATGKLSLRDPKIAEIRSDKGAGEVDTLQLIQELSTGERFR